MFRIINNYQKHKKCATTQLKSRDTFQFIPGGDLYLQTDCGIVNLTTGAYHSSISQEYVYLTDCVVKVTMQMETNE